MVKRYAVPSSPLRKGTGSEPENSDAGVTANPQAACTLLHRILNPVPTWPPAGQAWSDAPLLFGPRDAR